MLFKTPTRVIVRIACASLFYRSLISCSRCLDLCVLCREVEPAENHLKEMLQQLNGFLATKPSEKGVVCQGERTLLASVEKSVLGSAFVHLCACHLCIQIVLFFFVLFFVILEEAEDPACIPIFWISKWVDYSDKYGLGKNQGAFNFTVQLKAMNKCFAPHPEA